MSTALPLIEKRFLFSFVCCVVGRQLARLALLVGAAYQWRAVLMSCVRAIARAAPLEPFIACEFYRILRP